MRMTSAGAAGLLGLAILAGGLAPAVRAQPVRESSAVPKAPGAEGGAPVEADVDGGAEAAPQGPAAEDAPTGEPADSLAKFRDPERMPQSVGAEAQIVDRRGSQLPMDALFDDEHGNKVRLGDLFAQGRPVLLQLAYYRCPGLCTHTLDGLVETLRAMTWTAGEEFTAVTVSINPEETANLARLKQGAYLRELAREEVTPAGWRFLTGTVTSIRALAEATGFGFRFDTQTREFAHGAGLFVVTPEGVLSRTIYGAEYDPQLVRLSLVEAADGRVGSALDRVMLFCYQFDPDVGQYTLQIMNIVRLVGAAMTLAVAAFIVINLRRERRALAAAAEQTTAPDDPPPFAEEAGARAASDARGEPRDAGSSSGGAL